MVKSEQVWPISLRLSVTDQCQLHCIYCAPPDGVEQLSFAELLSFEEMLSFVWIVKRRFGLSKVHITGGEPLLRPGVTDFVATVARENVADLALTTNGQLLGAIALELKRAGLPRINISLDSLNHETFRWLTRGGELRHTLAGIEAALQSGLSPVKLNVTVLRNVNNHEVVDIARYGLERGCEVRFLELMPIGPAADRFGDLFVASAEVRAKLGEAFHLKPTPLMYGKSSMNYLARDAHGRKGIIGFISSQTAPFCCGCRRLRLTATGQLIGCLARGEGPDIRPLLRDGDSCDGETLVEAIHGALCLKRNGGPFRTRELMARVGG
ncbi:MAG: radical SAM protein [bacterium]|nr:radical SAM protein [bacterium]